MNSSLSVWAAELIAKKRGGSKPGRERPRPLGSVWAVRRGAPAAAEHGRSARANARAACGRTAGGGAL